VATEAQIDVTCRRLQASRAEIVQIAAVLREGLQPKVDAEPQYRSHIMRALTGQHAKSIGKAALSLALSRPRAVWKLTSLLPLIRPVLRQYLSKR
jgi:hypothetical protein